MRVCISKLRRFCHYRLLLRLRYASLKERGDSETTEVANVSLRIYEVATNPNKLSNVQLCSKRFSGIVIEPGETLSFWQVVGRPNRRKGFKPSRVLINGDLTEDVGGGICMNAGAIYYLALKLGIEVIERKSHSVDIYTDETRFTPLGTDAAVVYGFRDLQIRNNFFAPITLKMTVQEDVLCASFRSPMNLQEKFLRFESECSGQTKVVRVYSDDVLASTSVYQIS